MKIWGTALVMVAPAFLGGAAGWLTGQTGADSTVVAAVLPAVLTGGGGALLAFKLKADSNGWQQELLVVCGFVVVFSTCLVAGTYAALAMEKKAAAEERRVAEEQAEVDRELYRKWFAEDLDFRRESLIQCAKNAGIVNSARKSFGLPPIAGDVVCDLGPFQPIGDARIH